MSRKTLGVVTLVAVALAAGAGALAARWPFRAAHPAPPPDPEQPALTIDPQSLDFGEVWETDRFEWTISIENRGSESLAVTGLGGSCTCLSLTPQEFALAPGQQQRVNAVLTLRGRTPLADARTHEDFRATFWANIRGQPKPVYWEWRGRIRRSLSTHDRLDLGAVSQRSPHVASQRLPVRVLSDSVATLEVEPGPWLRTELKTGPEGSRVEVTVTPVEGLGKGKLESSVVLVPVERNGTRLPSVKVPVTLEVGEEVQATPPFIQFGGRDIGQEVLEVVALRSLGGLPFQVQRVRAEGSLSVRQLKRDEALVYEIRQRVAAAGSFEGRVIFDVVLEGGESFEVSVPVRGFGLRNP